MKGIYFILDMRPGFFDHWDIIGNVDRLQAGKQTAFLQVWNICLADGLNMFDAMKQTCIFGSYFKF